MNRDIEFRVWDDHYKYMNYKVIVGIYGNWEEVKDNENYTACSMWIEPKNVDYKFEPHWAHFEPYHKEIKLMQYTGLKDKNGKKIFEGDIVKNEDYTLAVVYNPKAQGFVLTDKNDWLNEPTDRIYDCDDIEEKFINNFFEYNCVSYEVIGNIYENKELLEG